MQEEDRQPLSMEEISLAWQWLEAPRGHPVPEKLKHLHPLEWLSLSAMLQFLLQEKERSLVH